MAENNITDAINELQGAYYKYMACLKAVLDLGDANIDPLVSSLNHKHASPIAKALGLMMYSPESDRAIPKLLDFLILQSPLYPDVLEALVRAQDRPARHTLQLIRDYASKRDDEAVRHLFVLACRFSAVVLPDVVNTALELLSSPASHIRETAADAIYNIGLPYGCAAVRQLRSLSQNDPHDYVRTAATEALARLGCGGLARPEG